MKNIWPYKILLLVLLLVACSLGLLTNAAPLLASDDDDEVSPNNAVNVRVTSVAFTWPPEKDTVEYKFVLARDNTMTQIIVEEEIKGTTAYQYQGKLDYNTRYFWRIMSTEPVPSDWSPAYTFRTELNPATSSSSSLPATPMWIWLVIIMVFSLIATLFVAILTSGKKKYA